MEYIFALCHYLTLPEFAFQYNRVNFREKVHSLVALLIMNPKIADMRRTRWC